MGFSRGFGTRDTPRTFAACQKLWDARHSKKKEYVTLGANTKLTFDERKGVFHALFHGSAIVTYHPDYKVIDACGHSESPTTQDRISRLANVHMHNNASLGFHQAVRVNGWPYFAGMRVDNLGIVFDEDRKPDFKTRPIREWTNRYATLWKRIYKYLLARWELGEFEVEDYTHTWTLNRCQQALLEVEEFIAGGGTYLEYEVVMDLLFGGSRPLGADLKGVLDYRKKELRDWWLKRNDGYETIEVQ